MDKQTVLITGGAGYIGSAMSELFLKQGYKVKAVDLLWFDKNIPLLFKDNPDYEFINADIHNIESMPQILEKVNVVIHAAAVVGEPASKKFPGLTQRVNYETSLKLITRVAETGLKKLIFFSTCSNYGIADGMANEETALKPLSLYAESKVKVERYLIDEAKNVDWVICRLSTVYGASKRMRLDLTVNDFALNAKVKKYLDIFLPYTYRPYIHVNDVARVIVEMVKHFPKVKNNVFNIGFPGENHQKISVAQAIKKFIPDLELKVTQKGMDVRDYQVDFSKLNKFLGIRNNWGIEDGIREVLDLLGNGRLNDYAADKYYNVYPDLGGAF